MAALWHALDAPHLRMFVLLWLGTMGRVEPVLDLTTLSVAGLARRSICCPPAARRRKSGGLSCRSSRPSAGRSPATGMARWSPTTARRLHRCERRSARRSSAPASQTRRVPAYLAVHDHQRSDEALFGTVAGGALRRPREWEQGHRALHKVQPGYLSKAAGAVDDYFADPEAELGGNLPDQIQPAACEPRVVPLGVLVEPRGIEPLTFAMPLRRSPS